MSNDMWLSSISAYNAQTTESRIKIVFPDIIKRLQEQKPKSLLDYGCGPGIFLRDFSSVLGVNQAGYDIAEEMVQAAAQNCKEVNSTHIVTNLGELHASSFDAITKTAVWMCWKSDEDCVSNLQDIRRLLAPQGKVYATVTHPAFHDEAYSTFSLGLDRSKYLETGCPYEVRINDQGQEIKFTDYHWPLSAMSSQIKRAGLKIDEIHEYPDTTPTTKGSPWMLVILSHA